MINWRYNPKEYNPDDTSDFQLIPEGDHIVKICFAEEKVSKTGKDMIELTLQVKGYHSKVKFWLVFDPMNEYLTNRRLGSIWDSFAIDVGNLEASSWINKVGAAEIVHTKGQRDDMVFANVKRFIPRSKQTHLYDQSQNQNAQQGQQQNLNFTSMREDPNFSQMLNEPKDQGGGNDFIPF